ncbi:MAG: iron ABC transporter permease [Chloroflexota bacterium]|nr:iron ABC transporter permease [Chloroflexota bacterium]MDE3193099.1 iron ABC transporter permease [Chloroflexota bacterium]
MTSQAVGIVAAAARTRRLPRPGRGTLVVLGLAAVLAYLAAYPLAMLILGTFGVDGEISKGFTLDNFANAYGSGRTFTLFENSLIYAGGVGLLALTLGTGLAWIVERTNTPYRRAFFALSIVPIIIPGIVSTIAWIFLLSGRIGLISKAISTVFGLSEAPFTIYSMPGMIWAEGLHLSPLVFLLMTAAFQSMDPSLEESALMSGASTLHTLRRVTLPVLAPALASSALIMAIRGLESFEVPRLIGTPADIPVFTGEIYRALHGTSADYGEAGALSMTLMVVTLIGIVAYQRLISRSERFATITGKAYRPRQIDIGRWRYVTFAGLLLYVILLVGLPFLALVFVSLLPYYAPDLSLLEKASMANYTKTIGWYGVQRGVMNSVLLGAIAATLVTMLTAVVAWIITKTKLRGRGLLDALAFIPITIPGMVLGVALILQYLSPAFRIIPIYGTLWILVICYLIRYMPYGMRANSSAMVQLHRELEEAGSAAGGSWLTTFRRVTMPLLRPALVASWLYIFIVSVRELGASVLLTNQDTIVLAVTIFEQYEVGQLGMVASLSVMLIVSLVVVVAVIQRVSSRFGVRQEA